MVFIVALWIVLTLAGLVLVFARAMRVEILAAANRLSDARAEWIARGALAFVIAQVDGWDGTAAYLPGENLVCEAVPLGEGYFWLLRPGPDDDVNYHFGIADESAKLNVNAAELDMLMKLPGMTDEFAASITDWRSPDIEPAAGGAKNEYYLLLSPPYYCKSGPFETVEELLLVKGAGMDILFGEDANRNGVLDPNEDDGDETLPADNMDGRLDRGIYNFVTAYGRGQQPGLVNVNTAPGQVLFCLPGLDDADVDALLAKRAASDTVLAGIDWVAEVLPAEKVREIRRWITVRSYMFSADIVAVSGDGRSFRRFRTVVDAGSSPPRVISWQDMTGLGWPLAPEILTALRNGQPLPVTSTGVQL